MQTSVRHIRRFGPFGIQGVGRCKGNAKVSTLRKLLVKFGIQNLFILRYYLRLPCVLVQVFRRWHHHVLLTTDPCTPDELLNSVSGRMLRAEAHLVCGRWTRTKGEGVLFSAFSSCARAAQRRRTAFLSVASACCLSGCRRIEICRFFGEAVLRGNGSPIHLPETESSLIEAPGSSA